MVELKRVRVLVSGKVQGVFFRQSTQEQAERLGVEGWVRNLTDGRVEGLFQGPAEAVDDLVAWCRRGPARARVEDVEVVLEAPRSDIQAFRVVATAEADTTPRTTGR